jgi:hypothetical protein
VIPALAGIREAVALLGWRLVWVGPRWMVCRRYLVLTRDLTPAPPPARHRPDLRWTMLTDPDVPRLVAMDRTLTLSEIRRRLAEGQECHLCWSGDALAHYRWEATGAVYLPFLGLTLRLLPGDVCATWVFTDSAFRGSGVHTATTLTALHRLRSRGLHRTLSVVAWWNDAALRVSRDRASRDVVGTVSRWQVGPWRRHVAEGAVRFDAPGSVYVAREASRLGALTR